MGSGEWIGALRLSSKWETEITKVPFIFLDVGWISAAHPPAEMVDALRLSTLVELVHLNFFLLSGNPFHDPSLRSPHSPLPTPHSPALMQHQSILAAVDLGSNSFRLQVARVEGDQLYMLAGLREPVRLAAWLTADGYLATETQQRAFYALGRLAERLRGLPREAVRAVGTNSFRVAKNAADFIPQAEHILGFPIEVVAGQEAA